MLWEIHHGRWSQTSLSWDWSEVCFNDGSWVCICVFSIHADDRLFSAYIYCMSACLYKEGAWKRFPPACSGEAEMCNPLYLVLTHRLSLCMLVWVCVSGTQWAANLPRSSGLADGMYPCQPSGVWGMGKNLPYLAPEIIPSDSHLLHFTHFY